MVLPHPTLHLVVSAPAGGLWLVRGRGIEDSPGCACGVRRAPQARAPTLQASGSRLPHFTPVGAQPALHFRLQTQLWGGVLWGRPLPPAPAASPPQRSMYVHVGPSQLRSLPGQWGETVSFLCLRGTSDPPILQRGLHALPARDPRALPRNPQVPSQGRGWEVPWDLPSWTLRPLALRFGRSPEMRLDGHVVRPRGGAPGGLRPAGSQA